MLVVVKNLESSTTHDYCCVDGPDGQGWPWPCACLSIYTHYNTISPLDTNYRESSCWSTSTSFTALQRVKLLEHMHPLLSQHYRESSCWSTSTSFTALQRVKLLEHIRFFHSTTESQAVGAHPLTFTALQRVKLLEHMHPLLSQHYRESSCWSTCIHFFHSTTESQAVGAHPLTFTALQRVKLLEHIHFFHSTTESQAAGAHPLVQVNDTSMLQQVMIETTCHC